MITQTEHVQSYLFEDDGAIPNNPDLPLLLYHQALALPARQPARFCEDIFAGNGWGNAWRNGIYPFHHYHSTAHEALAIATGSVRVQLGGELGLSAHVCAGDVIVIPAGVGHKNLGASPDLLVVGAYPTGQRWDLLYGAPEERPQALVNIARTPLPHTDPVFGEDGPLTILWARRETETSAQRSCT